MCIICLKINILQAIKPNQYSFYRFLNLGQPRFVSQKSSLTRVFSGFTHFGVVLMVLVKTSIYFWFPKLKTHEGPLKQKRSYLKAYRVHVDVFYRFVMSHGLGLVVLFKRSCISCKLLPLVSGTYLKINKTTKKQLTA